MAQEKKPKKKTVEKKAPKKEKAKPTEKQVKKPKKKTNTRFYLAISSAVLIILIAYFFFISSFFPVPQGSGGEVAPPAKNEDLKVYFIHPSNCDVCEQTHSFFLLLEVNNIDFTSEKFSPEENKAMELIKEFGIEEVPVVLVDAKTLHEGQIVFTKSGKAFLKDVLDFYAERTKIRKIKEYYVIPEIGFDKQVHNTVLLGKDCSGEKIKVDFFEDPYAPLSVISQPTINGFLESFPEVEFEYNFLKTSSTDANNLAAKYFLCAQEQGKLLEFKESFYSKYFNRELAVSEIKNAASEAGLDEKTLETCLETAGEKIESNAEKAESFGVAGVPIAVANCKYKTHATRIDEILCFLNPELNGC